MRKSLVLALVVAAVVIAALPGAVARAGGEAEARADARATLTVKSTRYGRILFDGRNRVLYAFTGDRRGKPSRCYGECAKAWPVYFKPSTVRAGVGVKRSLLGTTKRRDGRLQVTYNGWPLYYYAHEGPNEVRCQNVFGFGGLWLVVRPGGALVR